MMQAIVIIAEVFYRRMKTLIAVVGPTGIGKTKLGITLANYFNTEILSADSRQFYKEMEIGTAVPSKEELESATHYFVQHISIHDSYNVGDFEKDAITKLASLFKERDVVIMVGGSGLYVNAVVNGLDYFPDVDPEIREALNITLVEKGIATLQEELSKLDPEYSKQIDINNPHRIIRALEICRGTGKTFSSFLGKEKASREFNTIYVGITADRETIYNRINKRVDIMMANGLLDEVKGLLPHKNLNALQTVGYKELFSFLENKWALDFSISEIKKNTRRFAKRQLTWLRKNKDILWIPYNTADDEIILEIEQKFKKTNAE